MAKHHKKGNREEEVPEVVEAPAEENKEEEE